MSLERARLARLYCPAGRAGELPGFTASRTVTSPNPFVISQTVNLRKPIIKMISFRVLQAYSENILMFF